MTIKEYRAGNGESTERTEELCGGLADINAEMELISVTSTHTGYTVPGGVYIANNSACDMFIADSGEVYFLE